MADYKNSDRFKRTSKEIDPNIHKPEHIRRWSWIGKEGKTFLEITAPDSEYRKTLVDDRNYQGNHSKIGHHLTYDIEQISMIKRVQKNKEELIFGHIDGVKVGQIFDSREELALSGVHTPPMNGIWGREDEGSSSIVISGGYEDDIDNLDYILYTGQGGQDAPGGKQVSDQEFTRGNKGLLLSKDYNLPVRVTRGFQVEHGPDEGYRYDGLYYVTLCERVIGKSGHYVCRFHLESEKTLGEIEDSLEGTLPESYEKTDRTETTVSKIKRSIKLREKIKKMYDHKCQVCGIRLEKPNGAIAIGAHIKGLGKPHNGPDAINNMLCLCPNHHDQFDALSFYIESSNMEIVGLEQFKNKKLVIKPKHKIDTEFLDYQKERYELANGKKT